MFDRMIDNNQNRKPLYYWVKQNTEIKHHLCLKDENGYFITETNEIITNLTNFWNNIFINFEVLPLGDQMLNPPIEMFGSVQDTAEGYLGPIQSAEIEIAAKRFKNEGDPGTSDIPTKLFKHLSLAARLRLAVLFNDWWDNRNYPAEGELSRVTLLPKQGKQESSLKSYHTLSVGCNLCKLYLRVIEQRLTAITERSGLLGECQNGFRPNRRGTDNLFILYTLNRVIRKKGWKSFFTFIDLTKAFDRVDINKLWEKMALFGYPQRLIDAIADTYRNPRAILNFGEIKTGPLPMPVGRRQGCVLSPGLFAIYISDLSRHINQTQTGVPLEYINNTGVLENHKINILLYADDIVLIAKNQYELKRQLITLSQYAVSNKLTISVEKSFIFPINWRANQTRWPIYTMLDILHRESIAEKDEGCYLGVKIARGNNLFRFHSKNLKSKATFNKWRLLNLTRNLAARGWYGSVIWGTYGAPSILHGTEAMPISKGDLKKSI